MGLQTADLTNLDPNETNGIRMEALKTLFSAQIQYDQTVGIKNQESLQQFTGDQSRYNRLRARQDEVRTEQVETARQLAEAQFTLDRLKAEKGSETEINIQAAKVNQFTSDKAALDAESSSIAGAIAAAPSLALSTTPQPSNTR
jgi:mevalonate pyrophosphate decarboxylase